MAGPARATSVSLEEERASLRRLAALVATGAASADVLTAVATEVAAMLQPRLVQIFRWESDRSATLAGTWGDGPNPFPQGSTRAWDDPSLVAMMDELRTGKPVRHEDIAAAGAPIVVDGEVWGHIGLAMAKGAPLPDRVEERLAEITELVATAIISSTNREQLVQLADEQAALRRVATLVAQGAPPADVFQAVAEELGRVLDVASSGLIRYEGPDTAQLVAAWGRLRNTVAVGARLPLGGTNLASKIARTGEPARLDDYARTASGDIGDRARRQNLESSIGGPVVVAGRLWGAMIASSAEGDPLPADSDRRLAQFIELVGTAIANTEARLELARLADEQAALRRVATLVAQGAPPTDVFRAVAEEIGQLLDVTSSGLVRYEEPDMARLVAGWGAITNLVSDGAVFPLGGRNALTEIKRTGKAARIDDYGQSASGAIGERTQQANVETSIGGPVVVAGRLWGALIASTVDGSSLPADSARRLEQFTELVGTAIANTEARLQLGRLADEQAALRRVATLVAEEVPAAELFRKVGEEMAGVLGPRVEHAILRYEADATATVLEGSSAPVPGGIVVGERLRLDGSGVSARVHREKRAVRVDDYSAAEGAIADHASMHEIRGAIGCPIQVRGRMWGCMVVAHREDEPFPADTERRVTQFTELVATALANAEARGELQRLADEQAALRRVATLVAETAAPTELFDAVIVEVAQLLAGAQVGMARYEGTDECTVVAYRGAASPSLDVGARLPLAGDSVASRVLRTGRSARMNLQVQGDGVIARIARSAQVTMTIGAPITVEGRIWGVITASWEHEEEAPGDAEDRLVKFAALLDTAIANADSRDQLTASRARVLTAGDVARRRVVRDLHDGAQQRLVHTLLTLRLAQSALTGDDLERTRSLLGEGLEQAEQSNLELRELAHGILPAVLTHGGLRAAVDSVVARLDVPVDADVTGDRLPPEIEASAYFILAEALTNVVKHARATTASVTATVRDGALRLEVHDDGVGGADPQGHGLLGIGDRAAALGGRLRIDSPRGGGTVVVAELPA